MNQNKLNQVVSQLRDNHEEDESQFESLTVQETINIYYLLNKSINSEQDKEKYKEERLFVFRTILKKLFSSECIYVAVNKATHYPHIDEAGCIWVFSEKELGEKAVSYYEKVLIATELKEIKKENIRDQLNMFREMYGAEKMLVDNGAFNVTVNTKVLQTENSQENDHKNKAHLANPELFASILQYYEMAYRVSMIKEGPEKIAVLENNMMNSISKADFLVPVKNKDDSFRMPGAGEVLEVKQEVNVQIANIENEKDNTTWIPVFTDWQEFRKMYDVKEWTGLITSYKGLTEMLGNCKGAIINPSGVPVRLDEVSRNRIHSYLEDVNLATDYNSIADSLDN